MEPDEDLGAWPQFHPFPTTSWACIVSARDEDAEIRTRAWESLASAYWKPAFAYIRASTRKSADDARDLTQDFFLWMIQTALVHRADPARGRFRGLLKVAIRNFLVDTRRARQRLRRGGKRPSLSLNFRDDDLPEVGVPDPRGRTPEEILNQVWKDEILARVFAELEKQYRTEGKPEYIQIFRDYFLEDNSEAGYADLAAKYQRKVSDISNYIMNVKRRFRDLLQKFVSETVSGPEELREEIAWLMESRRV